jgi:hypothetical protein
MANNDIFEGRQTIKTEINGVPMTVVVCEHRMAVTDCPECDVFGNGSKFYDLSTRWGRLRLAIDNWFKR